jgi:hypothetical protein
MGIGSLIPGLICFVSGCSTAAIVEELWRAAYAILDHIDVRTMRKGPSRVLSLPREPPINWPLCLKPEGPGPAVSRAATTPSPPRRVSRRDQPGEGLAGSAPARRLSDARGCRGALIQGLVDLVRPRPRCSAIAAATLPGMEAGGTGHLPDPIEAVHRPARAPEDFHRRFARRTDRRKSRSLDLTSQTPTEPDWQFSAKASGAGLNPSTAFTRMVPGAGTPVREEEARDVRRDRQGRVHPVPSSLRGRNGPA